MNTVSPSPTSVLINSRPIFVHLWPRLLDDLKAIPTLHFILEYHLCKIRVIFFPTIQSSYQYHLSEINDNFFILLNTPCVSNFPYCLISFCFVICLSQDPIRLIACDGLVFLLNFFDSIAYLHFGNFWPKNRDYLEHGVV